jgi:hypothetical protein
VKANRPFQQSSRRGALQQPLGRLLQRGEVGDVGEVQRLDQRRMVRQMSNDAPVVGPQEVLQRQASEQLMLRELLRTAGVRIRRQRQPRSRQRR